LISRLGTHYALGLQAVDCQSSQLLGSEQAEAESRETVLRALGTISSKLRARLGESLASIRKYDAPVEQATTTSLEALQAYSLAIKTRNSEGDEAAIPFLKYATELDPDFAMAYAHLGAAYATSNSPRLAIDAIAKAYALRARVSERERLYIESHYFVSVTGEYERALQAYDCGARVSIRPNSYVNAGVLNSFLGNHKKNADDQLKALLWTRI